MAAYGADVIYQRSMAEKGDPKDPWSTEGAAVSGDAPTFEEGEQDLRPRRRSIRSKSRGVVASVGAAWDEENPDTLRVAKPSTIAYRNPKVFLGHEGKSGTARRIGGNGRGPHRPSSPHLAMGRPAPTFSVDEDGEAVPEDKRQRALSAHVAQRCDDLERLIVRKILSKQPVHRFDHALHECNQCTKDARDGGNKLKRPEGRYKYQRLQHKHTHWPHPEKLVYNPQSGGVRPKVVKGSKELGDKTETDCAKMRRASTYRTIDDMAGAGRLGANSASGGRGKLRQAPMVLPTQRGTGSAVLRTMITRYFSYWDMDESGELSMEELGKLLLELINVDKKAVPDEVLRGLLTRYDVNGDGTVTFDEIGERLLLVADSRDDKPLPVPDPVLHRMHRTPEQLDAEAKAAALERAADKLEAQWVVRLATKVSVDTPSMLAKSLRANLEWYDLDGSGQLEVHELTKVLSDALPAASKKEIECLVNRYDNQACGIVSIGRAVARMMTIVEHHNCAGDLGNMCTNVNPPDAGAGVQSRRKKQKGKTNGELAQQSGGDGGDSVKTPGQIKRMKMFKMETALVQRLRNRMRSDSHTALRRTLKRLMFTFDGGGAYGADGNKDEEEEELKYHQMIKALRLFFPAEEDSVLRDFVRHLDADRSGSISLKELSDRMIAGMKRLEGGQGTTLTVGARMGGGAAVDEEDDYGNDDENINKDGATTFDDEDSLADDIMDDALFDAPKTESNFQMSKRAAALEMALLTKLERRIKSGSTSEGRSGLARTARRYISHFAKELHSGKLALQHEDGSFDVELPEAEGGVLRAVSSACIVPEGKWEGYGSSRTWEGETEPLKEGMSVQFLNATVLSHAEFREAIKTSLPSATKSEVEMVLRLFDSDMNGFITVQEFADRLVTLAKKRDEGTSTKGGAANSSGTSGRTPRRTSTYLAKKRDDALAKKAANGPIRHIRSNFEY